ncbi:MAG: bifunctional phosphopantothenoylcysteine decarboxylase/phosphopantothenate--cysteine ligase CoaBC [Thermodesulfovibrionales bacterium]|nr:bifunctional phosphopantothenoylcysteine decarboxylase/phosphopantothenate--cysteine ligase CoaBC [Thermodesulfovibrionales bacterium]
MRDRRILKNKNVLLGLSGSIAVYRTVELARRLTQAGAAVESILTLSASKFINPLLMESVTGRKVYTNTFQSPMAHIELAQTADLLVVAPATANIIGKFASGIADDLLSTVFLAMANSKVLIAPAMNWRMYENPAVQENITRLKTRGVNFIGPEAGQLCCGEEGYGRMSDIEDIMDEIESLLTEKDLKGFRVLVTAGPTREYIDPVRFISNRSSGKMGFALAKVARKRGADVTIVSGPVSIRPPYGVNIIKVETTGEMRDAIMSVISNVDMVFMAGAPADFTCKKEAEKIRRTGQGDKSTLLLELQPTPDIIGEIGRLPEKPFLVGFAAETSEDVEKAREKLTHKGLDMIVLNNVMEQGAGFDADTNRVLIIDKNSVIPTELLPKEEIASIIIDKTLEKMAAR